MVNEWVGSRGFMTFFLVQDFVSLEKQVAIYPYKLNISTKWLNQILHSLYNKSPSFFVRKHLILKVASNVFCKNLQKNLISIKANTFFC